MKRFELSDKQWKSIAHFFPPNEKKAGRPWQSHRKIVNGVFWILFTGESWRNLPKRYGSWKTTYGRFVRWQENGIFDKILITLNFRLDENNLIDLTHWLKSSEKEEKNISFPKTKLLNPKINTYTNLPRQVATY